MANYANTKSIIAQNIYTNHEGKVTAEMVKTAANEIVNTLIAGGYLYAGVAKLTPTQTNPGSPDANVFYIATEPGTYTNFVGAGGALAVADGEVAIFKFNGTWSKEVTGAATAAQVTELGQNIFNYIQASQVTYNQTGWNSGYQSFEMKSGKTYRLTLKLTNWTAPASEYMHVELYAGAGGSYQNVEVTSLFGGASVLAQGNPVSIEYTPTFDVNYIKTSGPNSAYTPASGCAVKATAELIVSKFDEGLKIIPQTLTDEQIEQVIDNLDTDDEPTANSEKLVKSDGIKSAMNALVYDYTQASRASYQQTGWTSYYQPFALSSGKTYRLTLKVSDWGTGEIHVTFYASTTGSSQNVEVTSDFGGSAAIIAGNTITIEYTPTFNITQVVTQGPNSAYTPDEGCTISINAEEKTEKYIPAGDLTQDVNNILAGQMGCPINVFGDVLPESFKAKLDGDNDILIVCQGDSLCGLVQNCEAVAEPQFACPGGQYKHFVSELQKMVGKVKPYYNRLDSERSGSPFFSTTGTFVQATDDDFGPTGDPALTDRYRENSISCLTYRSASTNASASFVFDADSYNKCNIVFTKNIQAASAEIVIAEGNGKMLVSEDRITWVEANGFTHSQDTEASYGSDGVAECERHRRLWMKKASDSVTGDINITYRRADSDTTWFYFWGTEMYFGRAILFDNIGRGGRNTELLSYNATDIFDRNPDLTIYEMPMANDLYAYSTYSDLQGMYYNYFVADNLARSYRVRSSGYENFPLVILLPHIRAAGFDGNAAIVESGGVQAVTTAPAYNLYKKIYGYLRTQLGNFENVAFVNLLDQFLNEAQTRFGTYQSGLTGGKLTSDGTHLNQLGSDMYVKYISPIFQI